jgi:hypothetical protein
MWNERPASDFSSRRATTRPALFARFSEFPAAGPIDSLMTAQRYWRAHGQPPSQGSRLTTATRTRLLYAVHACRNACFKGLRRIRCPRPICRDGQSLGMPDRVDYSAAQPNRGSLLQTARTQGTGQACRAGATSVGVNDVRHRTGSRGGTRRAAQSDVGRLAILGMHPSPGFGMRARVKGTEWDQ